MSATASYTRPMGKAEYLAWETKQPGRWEFDGFAPVAMTGGTLHHNTVIGRLRDALRGAPPGCRTFTENVKLDCGPRVRYPDLMLVCHDVTPEDTVLTEALLVVEVVSPSSVHTDTVDKVVDYAKVVGLAQYLVLDPVSRGAALWEREGEALVPRIVNEHVALHGIEVRIGTLFEF